MPPRSREKAFHAIAMKRALTLTGGFSGKQFVPETREFEFTRGCGETAAGGVEVKECVRVGHKEAWLCEIATGQPVYHRPLARVRILRELTQLVASDAEQADKQMAALAFDSGESEDNAETPKKEAAQPRKRNKNNTPAVAGLATCKVVQVPEQPSARSKKIWVKAALDVHRRLWLDVDALPWLLHYVKAEKATGGIEPIVDEPPDQPASRIYWNFRDNNWIARAQAVDGSWLQTSRGVKRKQKSSHLDFEAAKKAAFDELQNWVAKVDAGEITKPLADASDVN